MARIQIKRISNQERYNLLEISKSEEFLNHLQDFVVEIGLAEVLDAYEFDGKFYDQKTFYTLFYDDPHDDCKLKKLSLKAFGEGVIVRYFNDEIELLVIFLSDRIELIFYCDLDVRQKVMTALLKFCDLTKS
jgi:hypothetical protein